MNRKPRLAASGKVQLHDLAATAQRLAEELVVAAQLSRTAQQQGPHLHLVSANCRQPDGDASLPARARRYLKARRLRDGLFPESIFADPAWDMLLELYACKLEGATIGVSGACIAASVPNTTALRCLDRLEECGLIERSPDAVDHRRIQVELTDIAAWRIELWLNATFHADPAA